MSSLFLYYFLCHFLIDLCKPISGQDNYMKIILFLFLLFAITLAGKECFGQVTFQKVYGGWTYEYGYSAQQTSDSGYIITGFTLSAGAGGFDIFLVRTDFNGDLIWANTYGGTGNEDGNSVCQSSDGGFVITGYSYSIGADSSDIFLLKVNTTGDTLWSKTYGGIGNEIGLCVQNTFDGGYVISGITSSFGAGMEDVYIIKTDSFGDTLWTKAYGGADLDYGYYVEQTIDSGYIISGSSNSFGVGNGDVYLIRTDLNGDTLWTKSYGGINYDAAFCVHQTTDYGFIISGTTQSYGSGDPQVHLMKADINGNVIWTKTFGGGFVDNGRSGQQTSDGGYIVLGTSASFGGGYSSYLIKTDFNGDTLWTKLIGGTWNEEGYSVQQTTDGGYIIGGLTNSFGTNDYNFYLVKTDANGNSNCYTDFAPTQIFPFTTQVSNTTTIVSNSNTIVTPQSFSIYPLDTSNTICSSVGITSPISNQKIIIKIGPNPFSNELKINTYGKGEIVMYDLNGKVILQQNTLEGETKINTKILSSGFYLLHYTDGKTSENLKVMKLNLE